MIPALVLAGGINNGLLKNCSDTSYEAMISIGEKPMVIHVLQALLQSCHIQQLVVVGPPEIQALVDLKKVTVISPRESIIENLRQGLELLAESEQVLVLTGDIPLITSTIIDAYLAQCLGQDKDIYYPIIPKETVEVKYPQMKRTYFELREGVFTGGNIFLCKTRALYGCLDQGEKFYRLRKSPLALCRLLGLKMVCRFVTKQLTVSEIVQKVSKLLEIRGEAVVCPWPEIGADVDKPGDLTMAKEILRETKK